MRVYGYWETVGTRWKDNDIYGHVNNAVFYSLMDTVINDWLIRHGGLNIHDGATIGLCVESHCVFKAPAAFPEPIRVGLRVGHLGRSSVRYEVGLFRVDPEADDGAGAVLAEGHFVHVFVDRQTRRPAPIEGALRQSLERLLIAAAERPD